MPSIGIIIVKQINPEKSTIVRQRRSKFDTALSKFSNSDISILLLNLQLLPNIIYYNFFIILYYLLSARTSSFRILITRCVEVSILANMLCNSLKEIKCVGFTLKAWYIRPFSEIACPL